MAGLLDLLLPALCPLCLEAEAAPDHGGLCTPCRAALPRIDDPCRWCGMPHAAGTAAPCRACADQGLPHIAVVAVAWAYAGGLKRLVGNAKAAGRPAAVRACAAVMPAPPPSQVPPDTTLVVPVPPARGRRPGPHLATALAKAVAKAAGLRMEPWLETTRLAREQHQLAAGERADNVAGLFRCRPRRDPPPARVLLVDDLLTSGATASAAASALRAAGVGEVHLVVLARTFTW